MIQFITYIGQTFYSQRFYADLIHRWKGIGMAFILLQVFLSTVLIEIISIPGLPRAESFVADIFDRLPDIKLENQKLSINRPSPYVVEIFPNDAKFGSLVFDTSPLEPNEAILDQRMNEQHIAALFTSDFMSIRKQHSIEIYNFSDYNKYKNKTVEIKHDQWVVWGKKVFKWGLPATYALLIFFSFLGSLMTVFFGSFIVKIFALFFTIKPDLSTAMRLAAAASTPCCLINGVFLVLNSFAHAHVVFRLPFPVGLLAWIAFVFYGLWGANKETQQLG